MILRNDRRTSLAREKHIDRKISAKREISFGTAQAKNTKKIIRRINAMNHTRRASRVFTSTGSASIYLASLHLEIANKDCKHSYLELLLHRGQFFNQSFYIARSHAVASLSTKTKTTSDIRRRRKETTFDTNLHDRLDTIHSIFQTYQQL
ncbi:hypothetical protein K0M31_013091 [Melipona bicolor]|uniref:Uncharacterized protein n=1 Tax=Melipona bicolor TaxID=60889 RepID=A0AA40FII9_9HYME|nr:hypothetical protein K0M31_013091 [Melipona bicolor]